MKSKNKQGQNGVIYTVYSDNSETMGSNPSGKLFLQNCANDLRCKITSLYYKL